MIKVIFLDIDGVLTTIKSSICKGKPLPDFFYRSRSKWDCLDKDCIERLNQITSKGGAKIVISSTWRLPCKNEDDFKCLTDYLHSQGIVGDIISKTPVHATQFNIRGRDGRGAEIKEWLNTIGKELNVENFVILDDCEDMGDIIDHLVLTSHKTGIIEKSVNAAIQMLS